MRSKNWTRSSRNRIQPQTDAEEYISERKSIQAQTNVDSDECQETVCDSAEKDTFMDINHITYLINGAVFEVNKQLGPGFLEKVYENALIIELKNRGLRAENQVPIKVLYKNNVVGDYFADIFVENQVIIEIKTVEKFERIHEAQLINYLKAKGIKVGMPVNFKHPRAEIKRMVQDLLE